MDDPIA